MNQISNSVFENYKKIVNFCILNGVLLIIGQHICGAEIARRQENHVEVNSEKSNFEIFYIEHEVSEKHATDALRNLTQSFFNVDRPAFCKHSVKCTTEVIRYCRSQRMLDDHCCCDHSHGKDKFPWLPHTCYISKNGCERALGACSHYEERRECCCEKIIARDWQKRLLGIDSGGLRMSHHLWTMWLMVVTGLWLRQIS